MKIVKERELSGSGIPAAGEWVVDSGDRARARLCMYCTYLVLCMYVAQYFVRYIPNIPACVFRLLCMYLGSLPYM